MLGRTISHFRIVEKLGQGGMGEVYRAEDTLLHRPVALKVLPASIVDDPGARQRFLREARSASALNHPHIITIHDVISQDGFDCIVMEFVAGATLAQCIPATGMEPDRAVRYCLQIADAVGAAHKAGIVHRDLKPANVMITRNDQVKVLDFGLAKQESSSKNTRATQLTVAGALLGTLHYMSPEQALGQPADARSDIFSLGVILYEMLSGMRPFQHDNPASLLHAVAYDEPADLLEFNPELPASLDPIVRRAMAKKPEDRFPSTAELAAALNAAPSGAPISGRGPESEAETLLSAHPAGPQQAAMKSLWKKARRFSATRPLAAASLMLSLVLVLAVVVFGQNLRTWLLDFLGPESSMSGSGVDPDSLTPLQLYREGRRLLDKSYLQGNLDRAVDYFERAISQNREHAASYAALSMAQLQHYDDSADQTWLARAQDNAQRAAQIDPQLALARVSLGHVYIRKEDWEAARQELEETITVHPTNAAAQRGLGKLYFRQQEYEKAQAALEKAVRLEPDNWLNHSDLGLIHYRQAHYEAAREALQKAANASPDNPKPYRDLLATYHQLDDFPNAAQAAQKMLEIQPSADGYTNLGTLYYFEGLYDQSLEAMKKAVDMEPRSYQNWANLGDVYRVMPAHEEDARQTYRHAVNLIRERLQTEPNNPGLRSKLAECLARSGDAEAALADMPRVEELIGENPHNWFSALLTYEIAGDRENALRALERTLDLGYSKTEIQNEVELVELRRDVRYHEVLMARDAKQE